MPSPTNNFAGMSRTDPCIGGNCGNGYPPDPNGDVGPNHYIEAVNSSYAIYSKTGTRLAAFTENQLWSTTGSNPCNGNSAGDPIVLYDALADRWILTHFAFAVDSKGNPISPFYQCIAASKSGDPVSGGWWMYALRMDPGTTGAPPVGSFNDYGKFGIWSDCLYMAANEFDQTSGSFTGTLFASFSRSDLYSGATLTWSLGFINNATGPFTMIPSHLSGQAAFSVPVGTPNYFVSQSAAAWAFEVRKFTPAANCGSGGALSTATNVSQTSYTPIGTNNVPQPGTTNKLDNVDDRLMQKVQYRKVGAKESLWVVHNVQTPGGIVTEQWAQIDVTGGTIATTPVQQQIYTPDATLFRWMGSLAVDAQGNMALGYSTSNATSPNFPSIAYSGRLASDPLNTLPQTETILIAGAGSQTNLCGGAPCHRWGDYSSMSVDPADDCTFWYTNQYYSSPANGSAGNWQTRIGSFKFASCVPSTNYTLTVSKSGTGTGTVTSSPAGINCGATCAASFTSGTSVTLTAVASTGAFNGWSGACAGMGSCIVAMNSVQSVVANFAPFAIIDHYYSTILNRPADSVGKAFWQSEVTRMSNLGVSANEAYIAMAGYFFTSAEFLARGLNDAQFVQNLYLTFFNRSADQGGLDYWKAQLASGLPRDMVMYAFMFSPEFTSFMSQNVGISYQRAEVGVVVDYYRGAFARLPDDGGLKYWVNQFRTAQCSGNPTGNAYSTAISIANGFFGGADYWAVPHTASHYTSDLYNAFMRRSADLAGYNYWVNQLTTNTQSYDQVRRSFIDTPEFAARVQAVASQACTGPMQ